MLTRERQGEVTQALSPEQMKQKNHVSAQRLERFLIERRSVDLLRRWTEKELTLIGLLKERGSQDASAKQALNSWVDAHERRAHALKDPLADIEFGLLKAQLYRDAGFVDVADEEIGELTQRAVHLGLDNFSYVIEDESK